MAKISTAYTYSKVNKNLSYCNYNGGWSSWSSSKLNGGYAGDGTNRKYCVAIKFTTPDFEGISENFVLTIPYCRSANTDNQAADGTLKLKLTTTDPRTGKLSDALADCNIYADWSARNSSGNKDKKMHLVDVTFTDKLEPATTYYIVIGTVDLKNNDDWIEIGEFTDEDKLWKATLNTYYTEGNVPNLYVTDKGNNTFAIHGYLGASGTANDRTSSILYYTTDGSEPTLLNSKIVMLDNSSAPYNKIFDITRPCTVKAKIICTFAYNTTSATAEAYIKYYVKPGNPGKPYLVESSFKNNRLTVKQDWGWRWTLASAANADSPVKGYRIRLYVNETNNPIVSYYNGNTLSYELSDNDWVYDRTSTSYPMPMKAADQDLVPGDTVRLTIQAYTINGAGEKLLSNEITSDTYTVQNAGIVNVKVNNVWHEGQVWVKANNKWHEAETVNARVDSWRESQ